MPEENENSLVSHLEALRRMLLRIVIVTALLYPAGYVLAQMAMDEEPAADLSGLRYDRFRMPSH